MGQGTETSGVDPMGSSGFSDAGVGGGGGIGEIIQKLLKDPQTMKEISALGGKLGAFVEATHKMSPGSREMLTQAVSQGSQRAGQKREMTPFVGDMLNYITPEMAQQTLSEAGIPYSRMGVR